MDAKADAVVVAPIFFERTAEMDRGQLSFTPRLIATVFRLRAHATKTGTTYFLGLGA